MACHHAANDPDPYVDGGTYDAAGGGVLYGKLDLSTVDAAYANLINVPAQGSLVPGLEDGGVACSSLPEAGLDTAGAIRVVPGDAGQSLLCLKLKGWLTDAEPPVPCGDPMPLTGAIPDGGQENAFTAVKNWINGGANP